MGFKEYFEGDYIIDILVFVFLEKNWILGVFLF